MLKKKFPQVKLIENRQNEGFARANNKAILRTKGRYVLLLNSDTVVLHRALDEMVAFMEEHREVGVVGCKLIDNEGNLQLSAAWFSSLAAVFFGGDIVPKALGRLLGSERFPGQSYLTAKAHEEIQDVDWVSGACFMVRNAVINKVGLLDEKLFMYGEEIDWCFRIKKAGWKVMYFPGAQVVHYQGGSTKMRRQIELATHRRVFAERYICHKHHNRLSSLIYDLIVGAMTMVKFPIWVLLLIAFPNNNKHKARTHLSYYRAVLKSLLGFKRMIEE
jgi:GT2 family glycosyltransferase